MRALQITVAALTLGVATAHCPNHCSGHGICKTMLHYGDAGGFEVCDCFKGWIEADCSERTCPVEYAWTDAPDRLGNFHGYSECSNRGLCDRFTGECECFPGFTGHACQRINCPNECSGHGTCEFIEDLHFTLPPADVRGISHKNRTVSFSDQLSRSWEHHRFRGCKCDAGFTDADCSRRMCPRSNDAMDERMDVTDPFKYQIQNVTLFSGGKTGNGTGSAIEDFTQGSFTVTFVSLVNESYTSYPIRLDTSQGSSNYAYMEQALAADIEDALYALPNKPVDHVEVNVNLGFEERQIGVGFTESKDDVAFLNIEVEMRGARLQGTQNLLTIDAEECMYAGCSPKVEGLNLMVYTGTGTELWDSYISEKQHADYNTYECGRRGRCDYSTGLCECFSGFMGESCNVITALT